MNESRHRVLVVGAGPAGLSAALALRATGLDAVIVERRDQDVTRPGSRAAYLHGRSLRALEHVSPGLGTDIAGDGLMWNTKRSFWAGREIYARTYPPRRAGGLPPFTSLPQVRTEDLMIAACRRQGVRIRWGVEMTAAEPTPRGVRLTDARGDYWEADYVIAADGPRSSLRAAAGRALKGPRSRNTFVVVDLDDDPDIPMPLERVFHYQHPRVDGRNVLIVPFSGGWRVDLNLRVRDDPQRFTSPEGLRDWLTRVLPDAYGDRVRWVSTYRFAQKVVTDFTDAHRRILLTGEAAHLFAPFGARGMNSSIPDGVRAARAVRQALAADTSAEAAAAVDRFSSERLEAATYNRACARSALNHMVARHPGVWLRRRVAATVATTGRRAGAWLDSAPYGPKLAARPDTSY